MFGPPLCNISHDGTPLEPELYEGMDGKLHAVLLFHGADAAVAALSERYIRGGQAHNRPDTVGIHFDGAHDAQCQRLSRGQPAPQTGSDGLLRPVRLLLCRIFRHRLESGALCPDSHAPWCPLRRRNRGQFHRSH